MQLISFNLQQVKEILELIGEDISEPIIKICETCGKVLDLETIGFIARGDNKNLLFCENEYCFAPIIAKEYVNQDKGVVTK